MHSVDGLQVLELGADNLVPRVSHERPWERGWGAAPCELSFTSFKNINQLQALRKPESAKRKTKN